MARLNQVANDEGIKVNLLSQEWDFLKQTPSFSKNPFGGSSQKQIQEEKSVPATKFQSAENKGRQAANTKKETPPLQTIPKVLCRAKEILLQLLVCLSQSGSA